MPILGAPMRVLCLGLDGADYRLVTRLLGEGRLPTLAAVAGEGTFGPLRSTLPAFTPTAWSSLVTGVNPGSHGIFGFFPNPRRSSGGARRGGIPLWRLLASAGLRSAFVTVPLTYPPDDVGGVMVSGFGGPQSPEIAPVHAAHRIRESHPDLVTAIVPTGWWHDIDAFADRLIAHADAIADVCMLAMQLEPDMSLLCVDFMSSDIAGHVFWHLLDKTHPAYSADKAGDHLVRVYEAVDRACGRLVDHALWLYGDQPTVVIVSDHGMRPVHWTFHVGTWLEQAGYLRFGAPPSAEGAQTVTGLTFGESESPGRTRGLRRLLSHPEVEDPGPLASIDMAKTRAYPFGYGGQVFLAEGRRARSDRGFVGELRQALCEVRHPETGQPALSVMLRDELYHGQHLDRAPDLVVVSRDESLFVDSTPVRQDAVFERHESLVSRDGHRWSGQHVRDGILAASGEGIVRGGVSEGAEISQIAATLLALHSVKADLESPAIEGILDIGRLPSRDAVAPDSGTTDQEPVYTPDEEAQLHEHLRALGYE